MSDRVKNRVCIVTGAAQGIGATYAKALAAEGAKLVVSDIDDVARSSVKSSRSAGRPSRCRMTFRTGSPVRIWRLLRWTPLGASTC